MPDNAKPTAQEAVEAYNVLRRYCKCFHPFHQTAEKCGKCMFIMNLCSCDGLRLEYLPDIKEAPDA